MLVSALAASLGAAGCYVETANGEEVAVVEYALNLCVEHTATNTDHEAAGRAEVYTERQGCDRITLYRAVGSGDNLGAASDTATLAEYPAGYYSLRSCGACGDDVIEHGEECDDGNTVSGDGCSATCEAEACAADDTTCDGIDDDCDGQTDQDYVSQPTSCGVGACAATGATSCVDGAVIDSCQPGTPAANDTTCDGVDDDCDGSIDEDGSCGFQCRDLGEKSVSELVAEGAAYSLEDSSGCDTVTNYYLTGSDTHVGTDPAALVTVAETAPGYYDLGTCGSATGEVSCALNPYAAVDWAMWQQYKANYHTHTTESDGDQSPTQVIDEYSSANYDILAITDHDKITWPWTSWNRNPAALGMLAVRGDEYSNTDHVNAFFSFTSASQGLENGVPHVESSGGLSHINHPGRYRPPSDWSFYIPWFDDYPSCVGIEVYNQGDRYPDDRRLWDNINENYFRSYGKLAWGYSNDDKHSTDHLYRNFHFMLMPELSEAALRIAKETGAHYFAYEPGGSGTANVPRINDIYVDEVAETITITATDYIDISWIGPGTTVVATGEIFDYSNYPYKPFVRAVLQGIYGDSFTQPFGFVTIAQ